MGNVVFAKEVGDAANVAVDDPAAAVDGYGVIGVEIIEMETELLRTVDIGKDFSVFEEGLTGDAAPIEADTTQAFPLDDGGVQSQLSGADGGDVTAGAGADDGYIVCGVGCHYQRLQSVGRLRLGTRWQLYKGGCVSTMLEERRNGPVGSGWSGLGPRRNGGCR